MMSFYYIFAAVLGLLVGSFLNVVAIRIPRRMMWEWTQEARAFLTDQVSKHPNAQNQALLDATAPQGNEEAPAGIVIKGSHCVHCQRPLKFYENIPLLSYVFLGGKCRTCKARISWQYPVVEASMGVLGVLAVVQMGFTIDALVLATFFAILLVLTVIDFRTQLLPDSIVLPAMWGALLWSLVAPQVGAHALSPSTALIGAMVGYLSLWSVFWIFKILTKKEGMGYGDFKLLALIGAFLGAKAILPVILISSVVGLVVGGVLLRKQMQSQPFAFGPYLALAAMIVAVCPQLLTWMGM